MTDTFPPPLPLDPLVCGPDQVPGWLNEHGEPTSCVSDHPCPGLDAATCEPLIVDPPEDAPDAAVSVNPPVEYAPVTAQPELPRELAMTGPVDSLGVGLGAALIIVVGFALLVHGRKKPGMVGA